MYLSGVSREPSPSKPRVTRELALILLLALAVRLLRILLITDVVEIEGCGETRGTRGLGASV